MDNLIEEYTNLGSEIDEDEEALAALKKSISQKRKKWKKLVKEVHKEDEKDIVWLLKNKWYPNFDTMWTKAAHEYFKSRGLESVNCYGFLWSYDKTNIRLHVYKDFIQEYVDFINLCYPYEINQEITVNGTPHLVAQFDITNSSKILYVNGSHVFVKLCNLNRDIIEYHNLVEALKECIKW